MFTSNSNSNSKSSEQKSTTKVVRTANNNNNTNNSNNRNNHTPNNNNKKKDQPSIVYVTIESPQHMATTIRNMITYEKNNLSQPPKFTPKKCGNILMLVIVLSIIMTTKKMDHCPKGLFNLSKRDMGNILVANRINYKDFRLYNYYYF